MDLPQIAADSEDVIVMHPNSSKIISLPVVTVIAVPHDSLCGVAHVKHLFRLAAFYIFLCIIFWVVRMGQHGSHRT